MPGEPPRRWFCFPTQVRGLASRPARAPAYGRSWPPRWKTRLCHLILYGPLHPGLLHRDSQQKCSQACGEGCFWDAATGHESCQIHFTRATKYLSPRRATKQNGHELVSFHRPSVWSRGAGGSRDAALEGGLKKGEEKSQHSEGARFFVAAERQGSAAKRGRRGVGSSNAFPSENSN